MIDRNKIASSHLIWTNITAWGRLRTSQSSWMLDVFVVKKHQCFFPRNLYKHIQLRKAHPWHSAYSICWMSRVLSNQTLPFLVSCCIVFALTSKGFDGAVVDESDLKLQWQVQWWKDMKHGVTDVSVAGKAFVLLAFGMLYILAGRIFLKWNTFKNHSFPLKILPTQVWFNLGCRI